MFCFLGRGQERVLGWDSWTSWLLCSSFKGNLSEGEKQLSFRPLQWERQAEEPAPLLPSILCCFLGHEVRLPTNSTLAPPLWQCPLTFLSFPACGFVSFGTCLRHPLVRGGLPTECWVVGCHTDGFFPRQDKTILSVTLMNSLSPSPGSCGGLPWLVSCMITVSTNYTWKLRNSRHTLQSPCWWGFG